MVIFCPIFQLGCFKASSTFTSFNCSLVRPRKGPPEAVIKSLSMVFGSSPFKDWKMALCSLSTGRICTPYSFARGIIICPAVTSVSLLARAISFPARIASMVGRIPIIPTMAVTRMSASGMAAISKRPSIPETTFTSRSATAVFSFSAAFSSQRAAILG